MIGQKWTPEEEARLFELLDEGKSFSECGAILGRGKNSCISRAHRSGKYVASERKPVRRKKEKTESVVILFPTPPEPPPVPRYAIPLASETAFGHPVSIFGLTERQCRWPTHFSIAGHQMFCAADRKHGSSYCCEHHLIAWVPPKTRGRDFERMARAYR